MYQGNPLHGIQLRTSFNNPAEKSTVGVKSGDREHGCNDRILARDQNGKADQRHSPGFLTVQAGESSGNRPRVSGN